MRLNDSRKIFIHDEPCILNFSANLGLVPKLFAQIVEARVICINCTFQVLVHYVHGISDPVLVLVMLVVDNVLAVLLIEKIQSSLSFIVEARFSVGLKVIFQIFLVYTYELLLWVKPKDLRWVQVQR